MGTQGKQCCRECEYFERYEIGAQSNTLRGECSMPVPEWVKPRLAHVLKYHLSADFGTACKCFKRRGDGQAE